jgi:soluble lytic murein transglycosylase-like protein
VPQETSCTNKECVKQLIDFYADFYGVDNELALNIAKCESELRHDAKGDGGKAYGVFQFHKPTFEEFARAYGDETLDYKNPKDNIKLAMWAISEGRGNNWTCYAKVQKSQKIAEK